MTTQEMRYLTAHDVTELLRIDKSTVYRMAEDGRLPGVKVGRQWRFPVDELERALGIDLGSDADSATLDVVQAERLTSLFADVFGVMAVVTDLEGRPATPVLNASSYFNALSEEPGVVETCIREWRAHAMDSELRPTLQPSRFGFECARAYIRDGFELVGMVIAGGIAPAEWPPPPERLEAIATEAGVDPGRLAEVADTVPVLGREEAEAMLAALSTLARHLSPYNTRSTT